MTITGSTSTISPGYSLISPAATFEFSCTSTNILNFECSSHPVLCLYSSASAYAPTVLVSGCRFETLTRSSGSGGVFECGTSQAFIYISFCYFGSCSCSDGSGGAIAASLTSTQSMIVSSTTFTGCSASEYGGGAYLSLSGSPSTLLFSSLTYSSNTATTSGNTLFVSTTSSEYVTASQFPDFMSCEDTHASVSLTSQTPVILADSLAGQQVFVRDTHGSVHLHQM